MFEMLYADEARLEQFLGAMASLQTGNFHTLAARFDFSKRTTVLDVGGANGHLSRILAARHPHLNLLTYDLPAVAPIARREVTKANLMSRIEVVARDFFKLALADKPAVPFKVPAGIKLVRVDSKTGMRAGPGDSGRTILEAFKPGTAPPDNYSVIGVADADGRPLTVSPDADRAIIRSGTGGLY